MTEMNTANTGEIVLYQPDETIRLEVKIESETVWLTQAQMAELFQTTKQNVSLHVNNIFSEGELDRISVVKESLTTASDGKKYRTKYYNLDVIISAGYRVKSFRGTAFRRWATSVLKEYLLKGFVIDHRIERVEKLAIETEQRIAETEKEIAGLKQHLEAILADSNDINEDTRMQLELLAESLAELQAGNRTLSKSGNPIGFRQSEE